MSWQENRDTVEAMLRCVSAGDVDAFLEHAHADVTYEEPYSPSVGTKEGSDALREMLAEVEGRFSRVHYELRAAYETVDPDLVIAEVDGDHDVAGSAQHYCNHYVMFVTFRDGKVRTWREFSNPDVYREAVGEG